MTPTGSFYTSVIEKGSFILLLFSKITFSVNLHMCHSDFVFHRTLKPFSQHYDGEQ